MLVIAHRTRQHGILAGQIVNRRSILVLQIDQTVRPPVKFIPFHAVITPTLMVGVYPGHIRAQHNPSIEHET